MSPLSNSYEKTNNRNAFTLVELLVGSPPHCLHQPLGTAWDRLAQLRIWARAPSSRGHQPHWSDSFSTGWATRWISCGTAAVY